MPSLNQEIISRIPIPLPDAGLQHAIAHILGSLDDKIEFNRRMNETLEAMAQAIFKSWFLDFDPVKAKASGEPADSIHRRLGLSADILALFPNSFQHSELGEIPAGWRTVPMSEIIEVNPPRSLKKDKPAPYVEMANMPSRSARVGEFVMRAFGSGMKFMNGDTLLARITPCLENDKTAFVDFLDDGQVGWGSTEFIVLRPRPPLPLEFGYFLAHDPTFRAFAIANMSGTSGRQRVPADCFHAYQFVEPHTAILKRFCEVAGLILRLVKSNDELSRTVGTVRDTLLPKLISGELRVSNVERW